MTCDNIVSYTDLATYIYETALKNYNESWGWSVIVECWSLKEIEAEIVEDGAATKKAAMQIFEPLVEIWNEQRADANSY